MLITRRQFTSDLGASAAFFSLPRSARADGLHLNVGVISDEISQDLDHSCYVISKEWGLHLVELREVWGKNLQAISDAEMAEAHPSKTAIPAKTDS